MEIALTITANDFDRLHNMSMRWGKDWATHQHRFTHAPLYTWKMAYWMGDNWLQVMVAQQFVSSCGYESQTVWDVATSEWVILTNYESIAWED